MDDTKRDLGIIRRILSYCIEIEETVDRFGNSEEAFSADRICQKLLD